MFSNGYDSSEYSGIAIDVLNTGQSNSCKVGIQDRSPELILLTTHAVNVQKFIMDGCVIHTQVLESLNIC